MVCRYEVRIQQRSITEACNRLVRMRPSCIKWRELGERPSIGKFFGEWSDALRTKIPGCSIVLGRVVEFGVASETNFRILALFEPAETAEG